MGEDLLSPYIPHTDIQSKYPIQVNHLRYHVVHIFPKKLQPFEKSRNDPVNGRLIVILIRHS